MLQEREKVEESLTRLWSKVFEYQKGCSTKIFRRHRNGCMQINQANAIGKGLLSRQLLLSAAHPPAGYTLKKASLESRIALLR